MALMGGYVETSAGRIDDLHSSAVGEWMEHNVLILVLGFCTLFWAAVAAIVIAL